MSRLTLAFIYSLIVSVCFGLFSMPTFAATEFVPSQYATIQAAINAAASGDTVLVADGTYSGPGNVDLDSIGKNLTLRGQNGAGSTIIDCGGFPSMTAPATIAAFTCIAARPGLLLLDLPFKTAMKTMGGRSPVPLQA